MTALAHTPAPDPRINAAAPPHEPKFTWARNDDVWTLETADGFRAQIRSEGRQARWSLETPNSGTMLDWALGVDGAQAVVEWTIEEVRRG